MTLAGQVKIMGGGGGGGAVTFLFSLLTSQVEFSCLFLTLCSYQYYKGIHKRDLSLTRS